MVVQLCDYAKNRLNCVHFKWVNFTVCEVYLNKDIHTHKNASQTRAVLTGNIYTRIGNKYNPNKKYKQSQLYNGLNIVGS